MSKGFLPLCFILMPFGEKPDAKGRKINFDTIYRTLIAPAVIDAGMEPIRADEERVGGFIHKPMFERLLMCDYAIADLTTANANVFYELGVRHAARPFSTLSIFAGECTLPFDVRPLRALPYTLDEQRKPASLESDKAAITKWLNEARAQKTDSPLYQFFDELQPHALAHEKTDIFRERVRYSADAKAKLAELRIQKSLQGLQAFEAGLNMTDTEGGILLDLFLSYRAIEAWYAMIALADKLPEHLAKSLLVCEQLGLALNRAGKSQKAEDVLLQALKTYGASSETYGILGRVYKDRYNQENNPVQKESYRRQAIETYLKGFEADWRDAYPGINAVTLMLAHPEPDPRLEELMVVVGYAVKRKVARSEGDYWDYATLMELAVALKNPQDAHEYLLNALPKANESFMPKTTADTLVMLRKRWNETGEDTAWLEPLIEALMTTYQNLKADGGA